MATNKIIEKIVTSKEAPSNKYVFWLDTSSIPPVLKSYVAGNGWASITRDDAEDAKIKALESSVSSLESDKVSVTDYENTKGFYLGVAELKKHLLGSIGTNIGTRLDDIIDRSFVGDLKYNIETIPNYTSVRLLGSVFVNMTNFLSYAQTNLPNSNDTTTINAGNNNSIITITNDSGQYIVDVEFYDNNSIEYFGTASIVPSADTDIVITLINQSDNTSYASKPTASVTLTSGDAPQYIGEPGIFKFKRDFTRVGAPSTVLWFKSNDEEKYGSANPVAVDDLENMITYKTKLADLDSRVTALENA